MTETPTTETTEARELREALRAELKIHEELLVDREAREREKSVVRAACAFIDRTREKLKRNEYDTRTKELFFSTLLDDLTDLERAVDGLRKVK